MEPLNVTTRSTSARIARTEQVYANKGDITVARSSTGRGVHVDIREYYLPEPTPAPDATTEDETSGENFVGNFPPTSSDVASGLGEQPAASNGEAYLSDEPMVSTHQWTDQESSSKHGQGILGAGAYDNTSTTLTHLWRAPTPQYVPEDSSSHLSAYGRRWSEWSAYDTGDEVREYQGHAPTPEPWRTPSPEPFGFRELTPRP
ncbi:hypothetical protein K474DRAFT_1669354 [Panus rudis PR-1116 ss-1]|nr:hypothetical protein K474DRAFT_1669354 [Panus rudis PR-1116 ss-1]